MPRLAGLDAPGILYHVDRVSGRSIFKRNWYAISLNECRSGSLRRDVVEAHGSISWIAVREFGFSGAEVARYLGVTNSSVARFVASKQTPEVDDLIKNIGT